jgi:hypothetical protein
MTPSMKPERPVDNGEGDLSSWTMSETPSCLLIAEDPRSRLNESASSAASEGDLTSTRWLKSPRQRGRRHNEGGAAGGNALDQNNCKDERYGEPAEPTGEQRQANVAEKVGARLLQGS